MDGFQWGTHPRFQAKIAKPVGLWGERCSNLLCGMLSGDKIKEYCRCRRQTCSVAGKTADVGSALLCSRLSAGKIAVAL